MKQDRIKGEREKMADTKPRAFRTLIKTGSKAFQRSLSIMIKFDAKRRAKETKMKNYFK